jgi:hypothetical protein
VSKCVQVLPDYCMAFPQSAILNTLIQREDVVYVVRRRHHYVSCDGRLLDMLPYPAHRSNPCIVTVFMMHLRYTHALYGSPTAFPSPSMTLLSLLCSQTTSLLSIARNPLNLGKIPLLVAERTHTARFEPALDAVQVKDVPAVAKGNRQAIVVGGARIGLVFNRRFIQAIATNRALLFRKEKRRRG